MSDNPFVPPRRHPVDRFLGPDEAAGGPFALLGLSTQACTDELVLSALDRQIDRIAQHPQCDTPEADEVRLALHAAAAQLLDPAVRRHLIARWSDSAEHSVSDRPAARPAPPDDRAVHPSSYTLLEHDAVLALGLFGGWNQQSLRRLLSIAHARGFNNEQVAQVLRALASKKRPEPANPVAGRINPPPALQSRPAQPPIPKPTSAPTSFAASPPSQPAPPSARSTERPSSPPPSTPQPTHPPTHAYPPLDEQVDPMPRLLFRGAVFTLVGAVAIAVCAAIILWVLNGSAPTRPHIAEAQTAPEQETKSTALSEANHDSVDPAQPEAAAPPPPVVKRLRPEDLPQEIAASSEALDLDAYAAGERLIAAINVLASRWHELPPDALAACHDALVEFIYLAGGRQEIITATVDAVAAGSTALATDRDRRETPVEQAQVLPAIWSVGMLSRLARETDLSLTIRLSVESHLIASLGAAAPATERTFRAGASAALLRMPQRLVPGLVRPEEGAERIAAAPANVQVNVQAWMRWAEAVEAFTSADRAMRNRMLLVGLETLLITGPKANQSRTAAQVITDLVVRLDWRDGDESRRWLLRAFGDRLITNADLNAVTSALATQSAAQGIDVTMVLSTSASDRVRADLRERYAGVWGVTELISREETALAWINLARHLLDEPFTAETEAHQLGRAALFARLNEAAQWQWRGEQSEAALLIADLRAPIHDALRPAERMNAEQSIYRSGHWAERYLAARQSIRARRDLLTELAGMQGTLGDVDAAVLVNEAVMGSPPDIRLQAINTVKQFGGSPAILSALLDRLPRMPRLASNSQLIEAVCHRSLPSVRDGSWPVEARRTLLEALLESMSSEGPKARVDAVAQIISSSYHAMGSTLPLARPQPGHPSSSAHRAATQLWTTWRATAEPLIPSVSPPFALSQVERRRAGRRAHARGPLQLFATEQISICELMAYIVTCERPGHADAVHRTMNQLAAERRTANHIFEQMIAVEAAMVRLWLIRLEAEEPT